MPLKSWARLVAAAGLSLAVFASFAPARAADGNPGVDARAARILQAALQNIAAAKSFTFEAEIIKEVPLDSGQRIQDIATLKTFVRRPDRLAAIREGGSASEGNMYYDGKVFSLWNRESNVYGTWEAPATIDALIDTMKEKIGFVPPLSALLREDAGSGARAKEILSSTYVGRTSIRGVACHHLAFTGQNLDFQAWIDEGVPVVRRVVVTYKNRPGAPQYIASFLGWDFNVHLSDYIFSFQPPPGARKIEFKAAGNP